jgi:hypothetical protein
MIEKARHLSAFSLIYMMFYTSVGSNCNSALIVQKTVIL